MKNSDGVRGKSAGRGSGATCIRAATGISGRFMITVCIWVGQSVFRPVGRDPGLSFAPASLSSASRIRPAGPSASSGWKLEIDQRRLESPAVRIPNEIQSAATTRISARISAPVAICRFCLRSRGCLDAICHWNFHFELVRKRRGWSRRRVTIFTPTINKRVYTYNTSVSSRLLFSDVPRSTLAVLRARLPQSRMHLSWNRACNHLRTALHRSRIYYAIGINNLSCVRAAPENRLPRYRIKRRAGQLWRTVRRRGNALKFHSRREIQRDWTLERCVASLRSF